MLNIAEQCCVGAFEFYQSVMKLNGGFRSGQNRLVLRYYFIITIVASGSSDNNQYELAGKDGYQKYFHSSFESSGLKSNDDDEDYKTDYFRNVGTSDFYELRATNFPFVDKSPMIDRFLRDPNQVVLITRPRRWGKSTNMQMLKRFLELEVRENGQKVSLEHLMNRKLFVGGKMFLEREIKNLHPLNISKYEYSMKEQGMYPVIYVSFSFVTGSTYQQILDRLTSEIEDLFRERVYLEDYLSPENDLFSADEKAQLNRYYIGRYENADREIEDALRFLSSSLYKIFRRKVYIFIDDFDKPLTVLLQNSVFTLKHDRKCMSEAQIYDRCFEQSDFRKTFRLLKNLLEGALKGNRALRKALVTGILRLEAADLFADMESVREYGVLDRSEYSEFYGFSQEEVNRLSVNLSLIDKQESIRTWYYGYDFSGRYMYNPLSVLKCLYRSGIFDTYWVNSTYTGFMDEPFANKAIQTQLQQLIDDRPIDAVVHKRIKFERGLTSEIFDVLLMRGYLTASNVTELLGTNKYRCQLSIPNYELKTMFSKKILSSRNRRR